MSVTVPTQVILPANLKEVYLDFTDGLVGIRDISLGEFLL